MLCTNCGKESGNNAKFCKYCGESIVPQGNEKKKGIDLTKLPALGGIILIALIAIFIFGGNNPPGGAEEPEELVVSTVQEAYPDIKWGYTYNSAFGNDMDYDFDIDYKLKEHNTNKRMNLFMSTALILTLLMWTEKYSLCLNLSRVNGYFHPLTFRMKKWNGI